MNASKLKLPPLGPEALRAIREEIRLNAWKKTERQFKQYRDKKLPITLAKPTISPERIRLWAEAQEEPAHV